MDIQAELKQMNETLATSQQEVTQLSETLKTKESEVLALQKSVSDKDAELTQMKETIGKKDVEIAELKKTVESAKTTPAGFSISRDEFIKMQLSGIEEGMRETIGAKITGQDCDTVKAQCEAEVEFYEKMKETFGGKVIKKAAPAGAQGVPPEGGQKSKYARIASKEMLEIMDKN